MKNIIEIKNLNYSVSNNIIFKDLNMKVEEGSFVGIAGNNTSGKTTLIKLIGGLLPSDNSIVIGYSYLNSNRLYDHMKDLGIVFGSRLNSFLFDSVYKEMTYPLENLNYKEDEIEDRILELSKFFDIKRLLDKKTYDLTNSEKQEVLIAIALLHKPKILLLDNPFSMMDNKTRAKFLKKLKEYRNKNKLTIVLTTTNLEDILESDYLYIINKGNVVIEGKPLSVLKEDTIINRLGLNMPFMVDLSLKLEFYKLINNIELDMESMVNTLWK